MVARSRINKGSTRALPPVEVTFAGSDIAFQNLKKSLTSSFNLLIIEEERYILSFVEEKSCLFTAYEFMKIYYI